MKKKCLALLLCMAMTVAVLAGCGGTGSNSDSQETTKATQANDGSKAVSEAMTETAQGGDLSDADVAVFYYTFSDTYISSVRTALDAELDALGVIYQDYDSNNNQTTQNEQVDTAISKGANVLVVNLVTTGSVDSAQALVDKASAAGIPIIFFNRAVGTTTEEEQSVLGSYDKCAFVGTDAPEAGHMQGQMIGDFLLENYDDVDLNGDGVISYAMFMGELGNTEAIYRTQYAVEDANAVLTEAGKPELEFFDSSNTDQYQVDQTGAWSAAAANEYMVTNLSQFNEENGNMIELVICNNDAMAEGIITALNDKGYNMGTDDSVKIPVFGVDATDAAKQLIADGKMSGTIKQDAEGMAACIAFLVTNAASGKDIMDGTDAYNISEDISNKIYIPYGIFTGE